MLVNPNTYDRAKHLLVSAKDFALKLDWPVEEYRNARSALRGVWNYDGEVSHTVGGWRAVCNGDSLHLRYRQLLKEGVYLVWLS